MSVRKRAAKGQTDYSADYWEKRRRRFERGDRSAVLDVIFACALSPRPLPLPAWAASAFRDIFLQTKRYEYLSWDEAFGPPHRKGRKTGSGRSRHETRAAVWRKVQELREKSPHRDVFQMVANEFGISKGTARKYYYQAAPAGNWLLKQKPEVLKDLLALFGGRSVHATYRDK
jgi:hypothetical protein